MRDVFLLGPRLQKCADFVRQNVRLADIGSDHGYLPIWLMLSQRVSAAIAADIGEGPLSAARSNAEKYHVCIKTVLSDGFACVLPDEVDDAVIAGMGGHMIASIIGAAPWLKDSSKRLILQPMTAMIELREYLFSNGFEILREEAVTDDKKVYSVMLAQYTGNTYHEPIETYMGKIVPRSEFSSEYAKKIILQLNNRLKGYEHRGESGEYDAAAAMISEIEKKYLL